MLGMMDGAFAPSLIYPDQITFMTSVKHLQSVRADNNCVAVVEKIKDLLTTKSTRLQGLQFLEIALQQNADIYLKGHWTVVLFGILKEPVSHILKEHACKIICQLIPNLAKDAVANAGELHKFATELFPFLLKQIENKVEWIEPAAVCLCACLKCFPLALETYRKSLQNIIYQQISYSVSSKTFEVFAECYTLIPTCVRDSNKYAEEWNKQYLTILNSMHKMLNTLLSHLHEDQFLRTSVPGAEVITFDDLSSEGVYADFQMRIRCFINLSKCLAKMLSTQCKCPVQVPVKLTLKCLIRLFHIGAQSKSSLLTVEQQIILASFPQMMIAALVVVESLISNFPNILPHSVLMSQFVVTGLSAPSLRNLNCESISPLHEAVWRLVVEWVSRQGTKAAYDIVCQQSVIIEEMLKDISIEDSSQATPSKSKKSLGMNSRQKGFVNESQQVVCLKALEALECVLYSGASFLTKELFQEIFSKVVQVAYSIIPPGDYSFPYDDDMCRKGLYSVLLALVVVSKPDNREPFLCSSGIFRRGLQDPSTEVVRICHRAIATCRLYLHPKKPIPVVKDSDEQQMRAPNAVVRYPGWSADAFPLNLPPMENVSENRNQVAQAFRNPNECEMPSDEYMQIETHYSEQAAENQCNGEDILEIQNSSQCQDDVDSDEDEEEDEEEEEDEPCFADEEINEDVEMQEHLYIPSTSEMQVLNPVHITPETNEQNVEKQEYEELRPCKSDDSNKNMHLNGVRSNIVPEEEIPSASTVNVANENGIYDFEDEELEDEEEENDEDKNNVALQSDKKVSENPIKKQNLDNETNEKPEEEREGSRSPTLVEMKADFCCNEVDNVKS